MSASDPQTAITETSMADSDPGRELLRWRSHPLRRGGWRLVIVSMFLLGTPFLLTAWYGPFFGLLALVILGGALGAYFLPTDYVMYAGGLESRFIGVTRRFAWDQFRSFYPDRNGVLLSPFAGPSRLENFRGVFLRFDDNRDVVLEVVRERMSTKPVKSETLS